MGTWVSESLAIAWVILQMPDFEDGEAVLRGQDLPELREAVQLANTELVTALRQRDEALEALTLLAVTTEREVARVSSQRDEALAENGGLKAKLVQVENEKDLAYKQIEFLQIINELAGRADNSRAMEER